MGLSDRLRSSALRLCLGVAVIAAFVAPIMSADPAYAAVPANDSASTPETIASLPYSFTEDTTEATSDPLGEGGCAPNNSVWFSYTPVTNQVVQASTDVLWASIGIYAMPGVQVACGHVMFGGVSAQLVAGRSYLFQVGSSFFASGGQVTFSVSALPTPPNDSMSTPEVISSLPYSFSEDTSGATTEPGEPVCAQSHSVWFSYTPAEAELVAASTTSSFGTALGIFGPGMQEVQCAPSSNAMVSAALVAGQTYLFQVGSGFGGGGQVTFNVVATPPPSNDDIASALVISPPLPQTAPAVSMLGATAGPEDPPLCGSPGTPSVWYRFDAAESQPVVAEVATSTFVSVAVSAFTGEVGALVAVPGACGYGSAAFDTQAGSPYWVMVTTSPGGGTGFDVTLSMREVNKVVGLTVDRSASLHADGSITLTGTVTCTASGTVNLLGDVKEVIKQRAPVTVSVYLNSYGVPCDRTARWQMSAVPWPSPGFVVGTAKLNLSAISFDGSGSQVALTDASVMILPAKKK